MATGEKLPNTNLNLIQDSDVIDHADINAIAQAVETTTKPVEAVLTADKFNINNLKLHRIGRLCVTTGYFSLTEELQPSAGSAGYHTIGRVPEGFRPPMQVYAPSMVNDTGEMVVLLISSIGTINIWNYGTQPVNGNLTANLTWITNG